MPLYDFSCSDCGKIYEEFASFDETGVYEAVKCPACGSNHKTKVFSGCVAFAFTNPVGTKKYNASHELRYRNAIEKKGGVRDQRAMAEKLSHMGSAPYNDIDDVSSGKYFGEVK